jgi:hypothetical protein
MKNLTVGIGSVVVDGVPAGPRNGAAIGRSIERALGSQIREGALAGMTPRDLTAIRIGDLRLPANPTDAQIGEAVAAAIERALRERRHAF